MHEDAVARGDSAHQLHIHDGVGLCGCSRITAAREPISLQRNDQQWNALVAARDAVVLGALE
jgi:hypothetical protein